MNEQWLDMRIKTHYAKEHGITEGHRPGVVALEGENAVIRCGSCGAEIESVLRKVIGR